ncbi:MAG: Ig-like domain-containing protein [Firmicutes bacterium]|nr:Ig-like domain-containing protein [Bacillota bacterium]MCM1401091.1 Ig-like domain-containing protein [Bacteroides sp.]MCM1477010.1 Ig-like domain-containing protein [Bacteroides sp.]
MNNLSYLRLPLLALVAALVAACASMGRPEGGPRDETPPVFVKSRPAPSALNVSTDRIVIEFDENIQVDDPLNKVVVSPAQSTPPRVTGVGHRVTVNLMDSLIPNTTYTIDFTDAIKDLNEGNILDGFAMAFSTGSVLDSLCISGMVFQAENLEPAQAMLVGVHSNLSDTALTTLPFDRITRTNQLGQFTIRNLKPGNYHVFAINDVNRDNKWDRSEDVAFYPVSVSPTASRVNRTDTVKASDGVTDSIIVTEVTAFAPNDLLLTWFNENYKAQYITKNERRDRNKIIFEMGAPSDTFPSLRFVGGKFDGEDFSRFSRLQASATRDTLTYWITDTALVATDSIYLATTYLRTDSLNQLVWTTDTLNFSLRPQKEKKEKKKKKDEEADSLPVVPEIELLKMKSSIGSQAEVYSPLILEFSEPVSEFNPLGVHLEIKEGKDTVWTAVDPPEFLPPGPYSPLTFRSDYKWVPGAKYRFTLDSLAVVGIYDHHIGRQNVEFSVRPTEDYGNITFNISSLTGPHAFVQLLNSQDAPVWTLPVTGNSVTFNNVLPGTYYARLIDDRNNNLKWDTGSITDSIQPEDVFYFPKKINLKKNWDITQSWDILETPVDLQKPQDIKKNKPKRNKNQQDQYPDEEEDQYYDEFGNPAVDPDDPFGKRKNRNYNRTNRNNVGRNGLGSNGIRGAVSM